MMSFGKGGGRLGFVCHLRLADIPKEQEAAQAERIALAPKRVVYLFGHSASRNPRAALR